MHPDLIAVERELQENQESIHRLAALVDDETWMARPAEGVWSMSECIAHLALSSHESFPGIDGAIAKARLTNRTAPTKLRRDPIGWLVSTMAEPPYRIGVKTKKIFVPDRSEPRAATLAAFDASQDAMRQRVRGADGLDATAVSVHSPMERRVKYNLISAFRIATVHQRRHIWQAEQGLARLRAQRK